MKDQAAASTRLVSLDALRGLTVAGMILVNTAGGVALGLNAPPIALLEHSHWAGLTLADLVFPAFLTIMGVSITLSLGRQQETGLSWRAARQITGRSLRLFALGFLLTNLGWLADFDSGPWRLFGVLQRIGLVYGICALLVLAMPSRPRLFIAGAILILYWPLCLLPTMDGIPTDLWQRGMNFVASTDRSMLGAGGHNYVKGPLGYDPEGLLSTLPCIAQGLIGIAVGEYLIKGKNVVRGLLLAGGAMTVAGLAWGLAFPVVKDIWTSSFVLLTCGITTIALALAHLWLDGSEKPSTIAKLFLALTLPFGINAILVYVLHYVMAPLPGWQIMQLPFNLLEPVFGAQLAALAPSLIFMAILWILARYLFQKRWLVKI